MDASHVRGVTGLELNAWERVDYVTGANRLIINRRDNAKCANTQPDRRVWERQAPERFELKRSR